MKRRNEKQDEPTLMLLRLFRIADLLATVTHDQLMCEQRPQQYVSKTQD